MDGVVDASDLVAEEDDGDETSPAAKAGGAIKKADAAKIRLYISAP
jgi:hypothetical protein